jgi:hypothetical protein
VTGALGWVGSVLIVASLAQRRQMTFRLLNLASAVVLLAFNLAIGLWSMVALNVTILIVNAYQLYRLTMPTHGRRSTGAHTSASCGRPHAGTPTVVTSK